MTRTMKVKQKKQASQAMAIVQKGKWSLEARREAQNGDWMGAGQLEFILRAFNVHEALPRMPVTYDELGILIEETQED